LQVIKLAQLIELVEADVADAGTRIQQVFEWHHNRDLSIAKWVFGISASLMIAVIVAFFRGDTTNTGCNVISEQELLMAFSFAAITAAYGIYMVIRLRRLNKAFIAALKLYSQFYSIREFIRMNVGV